MKKNKYGIVAVILAAIALYLSAYTSYSVAMNDELHETPTSFINFINLFHLNDSAPVSPEIKPIFFTLFDDTKRTIFYIAALILVLISTALSITSYANKEHSLFYASSVLFCLSSAGVINNLLFVGYFIIILAYAYYDKQKKLKNITRRSSSCA